MLQLLRRKMGSVPAALESCVPFFATCMAGSSPDEKPARSLMTGPCSAHIYPAYKCSVLYSLVEYMQGKTVAEEATTTMITTMMIADSFRKYKIEMKNKLSGWK